MWQSTFSYTEMKHCDGKCWIFRDHSSRSSWLYDLVVGGPVRSRGLDLVILTGPLWQEMFCDSMALELSPAVSQGQRHLSCHQCHQVCQRMSLAARGTRDCWQRGQRQGRAAVPELGSTSQAGELRQHSLSRAKGHQSHPCLAQVTLGTPKTCTNI